TNQQDQERAAEVLGLKVPEKKVIDLVAAISRTPVPGEGAPNLRRCVRRSKSRNRKTDINRRIRQCLDPLRT
ncbi:hypothetical protein MYX82_14055, partial [Acidobacteria bacterium AH-259-D05]|nr:hypothetical protein [Acidobacteria bacterium AH-259-D05]